MGYFGYYLAFALAAWLLRYPWLLGGVAVFFLLRRWIPDPWVLARTAGKIRRLRMQVEANPANAIARRDLASIHLARRRPRAALRLLDEARERFPDDAELLFLTGLARHRIGEHERALEPLVACVGIDPKVRRGEPFLVAAQALARLDRLPEAEDALERYCGANQSSIEGRVRLALVHRRRGEADKAAASLREALATWKQIPGFVRRRELRWWLRAQLLRLGL